MGKDFFDADATEEEEILLARLIHAEAESEPFEGKVAVGAVIINRVRDNSFPNSITEVIFQRGEFESVDNGRLQGINKPNEECRKAAFQALMGEDPTRGALFFYNPRLSSSSWMAKKKVKVSLGKHLFL